MFGTKLITYLGTTLLLVQYHEVMLYLNHPLLGHQGAFIRKNNSKREKFLLHLKSKLYHETVFTLTHISTTLSMHWGTSWAEGLGSFASGKEFGSPAFRHTLSQRTFETITFTVRYTMCHEKH